MIAVDKENKDRRTSIIGQQAGRADNVLPTISHHAELAESPASHIPLVLDQHWTLENGELIPRMPQKTTPSCR